MQYKRKAEMVEAFQFGAAVEISAPDWFMKELEKERIFIDRAITDGAVRIYGCTIVRAADGSIFPVKKSKFKSQYERAEK